MGYQAPSFQELLQETPATRKHQALRQILNHNNCCQVWIGGSENDRFHYPYRLVPVDQITDRVRKETQVLMLDSSIGDPSITNREVIKTAIEYDAHYVIPKDYCAQGNPSLTQSEAIDKTHESIREFNELYHDLGCESTIIFPLQPPHDVHYERYEDFYSRVSHLAVGGVRDASPEEQLAALKTTRDVAGPYTHIHGLGMGCSEELLAEIRETHNLVDSIDVSTFETLPGRYGGIADATWKQIGPNSNPPFELPQGEKSGTISAIVSEYLVYMANYQLTDLPSDSGDGTTGTDAQMTLSESWGDGEREEAAGISQTDTEEGKQTQRTDA